MGASISNYSREIEKETNNILELEGSKNVCTAVDAGVKIIGVQDSIIRNLGIKQTCQVDSKTYFDAMLKALTKLSAELETETKSALGISASNVSEVIRTKVNNIIRAKCEGGIAQLTSGGITIADSKNLDIAGIIIEQAGQATGTCDMKQVIEAIDETVTKAKTKTTGSTFAELMFGPFGGIILGVIVIIGLVLGFKYFSNKKGDQYRQSAYPTIQHQQLYQPPPQPYFQ